jgi:hypothetical protein
METTQSTSNDHPDRTFLVHWNGFGEDPEVMKRKTEEYRERLKPPYNLLDPGIRDVVKTLNDAGVETFESCDGQPGHTFHEPTVRFYGDHAEGFRVFAITLQHGLRVLELRRSYDVINDELVGPYWEMIFPRQQQ